MRDMQNYLRLLLLLPLLSACLIVEQYGGYWEKGTYDPCLLPVAETLTDWGFAEEAPEDQVRWVLLNDAYHLLMLKEQPTDKGGHAYLYRMEGKLITVLTPNAAKRKLFLAEFPDAPVVLDEDTITIRTLNEETFAFLKKLAMKEEYWSVEDSRIYNTRRNEACPQYTLTEDD